MLTNPKTILFDEPTSALDNKNRDKIAGLINDLKNNNYSVIVVTHDSKLIDSLYSKIFDMNNI